METLGGRFSTQPNALNLLRLLLASTVVVHHSIDFSGTDTPQSVYQLLSMLPVDAFFAISGFLICRSWAHRPDSRAFLAARATRLLPGLCGAVIVTAFVLVPLVADPGLRAQVTYVGSNIATLGAVGADGLLVPGYELPAGSWNGPLWTLAFEGVCYLAVLALGVIGMLRVRNVAALAVTFWLCAAAVAAAGLTDALLLVHAMPRLGLMFTVGALLWLLRDRIPVSHPLAIVSLAMLVAGSFTPDYRLLAAPAVAYLCLYGSLQLGRWRPLVIRNDVSYGVYVYGWPLQVLIAKATDLNESWLLFAVVSLLVTLAFAAASWFGVERPAMRLRQRLTRRNRAPVAETPAPTGAVATPAALTR